jgi:hypothetical protein
LLALPLRGQHGYIEPGTMRHIIGMSHAILEMMSAWNKTGQGQPVGACEAM